MAVFRVWNKDERLFGAREPIEDLLADFCLSGCFSRPQGIV